MTRAAPPGHGGAPPAVRAAPATRRPARAVLVRPDHHIGRAGDDGLLDAIGR